MTVRDGNVGLDDRVLGRELGPQTVAVRERIGSSSLRLAPAIECLQRRESMRRGFGIWLTAALAATSLGPLMHTGKLLADDQAKNTDLCRFLPNHGNSVYNARGLLRQWPPGGPKELWRMEVGWGRDAVVEAGGRAFTAAETDNKQWALCLDPATGATRWKHLLLPKGNHHFERGPVTSPVIDGDRIYFIPYAVFEDVWDMRCPIICLKTDGTELWRADKTFWGTEASTPLVVGDTLYVAADNPQRVVLVALDKMTRTLRWAVTAKPEIPSSHHPPRSPTRSSTTFRRSSWPPMVHARSSVCMPPRARLCGTIRTRPTLLLA